MRASSAWLDVARADVLGAAVVRAHPAAVRIAVLFVLLAACAGTVRGPSRPTTGAIAGLARDHDTGDPVALAEIRVRGQGDAVARKTTSNDHGLYDVDHLRPGKYQLTALFAGQPVEVVNIDVVAGETTFVDVVFTLGRPEPLRIDYGDPRQGEIVRYRPPQLASSHAIIEGTVNEIATRRRIAGAVVTAVRREVGDTQQTVSDDHGRFRFDQVAPGTYSVSAYYSIAGRGQVEVRRSQIALAGAEAVIVPLWLETIR